MTALSHLTGVNALQYQILGFAGPLHAMGVCREWNQLARSEPLARQLCVAKLGEELLPNAGERYEVWLRASIAARRNVVTPAQSIDLQEQFAALRVVKSPSERTLVSLGFGYDVKVWDIASGTCRNQFKGPKKLYTAVMLTDNEIVIGTSERGIIERWDLKNGKMMERYQTNSYWVQTLLKVSDKRFISCTRDGEIRTWDAGNPICVATKRRGTTLSGASLSISGSGFDSLITGHNDNNFVRIWHVTNGIPIQCMHALELRLPPLHFNETPLQGGLSLVQMMGNGSIITAGGNSVPVLHNYGEGASNVSLLIEEARVTRLCAAYPEIHFTIPAPVSCIRRLNHNQFVAASKNQLSIWTDYGDPVQHSVAHKSRIHSIDTLGSGLFSADEHEIRLWQPALLEEFLVEIAERMLSANDISVKYYLLRQIPSWLKELIGSPSVTYSREEIHSGEELFDQIYRYIVKKLIGEFSLATTQAAYNLAMKRFEALQNVLTDQIPLPGTAEGNVKALKEHLVLITPIVSPPSAMPTESSS